MKEIDVSIIDGPDEIQERNEENLQLHKVGKAKWHEGLASNSEADVKADRGDMEGTEEVEEVERLVKRRFTPARPAQMEPEVKENGDKK
ncbi:hypothetical protein KEM55_004215 [Ascosphaera atra]|nr:hypothetical protein KEM55_004215 [Ascosphaera atra]